MIGTTIEAVAARPALPVGAQKQPRLLATDAEPIAAADLSGIAAILAAIPAAAVATIGIGAGRLTTADVARLLACLACVLVTVVVRTAVEAIAALPALTIVAEQQSSLRAADTQSVAAAGQAWIAANFTAVAAAAVVTVRAVARRLSTADIAGLFTGLAAILVTVVVWAAVEAVAAFDTRAIVAAPVSSSVATDAGSIRACLAFGARRCGALVCDTGATSRTHIRAVAVLAAAAGRGIDAEPSGRSRATAEPSGWAAKVRGAHIGRTVLIGGATPLGAQTGDTRAARAAPLVRTAIDPAAAAFPGNEAEVARVWTAQLFAIADTVATGVVAALAMRGGNTGRIATGGTAFGQP
jgi:hypothetical protein